MPLPNQIIFHLLGHNKHTTIQRSNSYLIAASSWGDVEGEALISSLWWPVRQPTRMAWSRVRGGLIWALGKWSSLGGWVLELAPQGRGHSHQELRKNWTMLSDTLCDSWHVLCKSWTWWSWWNPSNSGYSTILGSDNLPHVKHLLLSPLCSCKYYREE